MSISGISAPSIAALFQQSQSQPQVGAGPQTTVDKASAAPLGSAAPSIASTQQTGVGHHHHGGNSTHAVDTLA